MTGPRRVGNLMIAASLALILGLASKQYVSRVETLFKGEEP